MAGETGAADAHLPTEGRADEPTRWGYVFLALLAAGVGYLSAPAGWPTGTGSSGGIGPIGPCGGSSAIPLP